MRKNDDIYTGSIPLPEEIDPAADSPLFDLSEDERRTLYRVVSIAAAVAGVCVLILVAVLWLSNKVAPGDDPDTGETNSASHSEPLTGTL